MKKLFGKIGKKREKRATIAVVERVEKNDTLAIPQYDLIGLSEVKWLQKMLEPNEEKILLSAKITKMNRFGVKQDRVFFVTNKCLYNYSLKKNKPSKKLQLQKIDGITISKQPQNKSDEFLLHIRGGYDHRYSAGKLRDTIVDLLRRLKQKIKQEFEKSEDKENIYMSME